MDLDQAVSGPDGDVIAGIGFRRRTGADEMVGLIREALDRVGLPHEALRAIATAADRADEEPVRRAAEVFSLVPIPIEAQAMIAVDDRVPTRSSRITESRGVGSLAEAAALVAAGEGGRLVLPRIASAGATCALAISGGSVTPSS